MPINTDLNKAPYFDDFDQDKQYYRVLFKPGFAVQARELIQLQSMLQNQVEQFGDNIFKEGSIVKGCNFTNLDGLQFVKINDGAAGEEEINPLAYVPKVVTESIQGINVELDYVYVLSNAAGLRAEIIQAATGFLADPTNKKTFFINYLNSVPGQTSYNKGDALTITLSKFKRGTTDQVFSSTNVTPPGLAVISLPSDDAVGNSFGIQSAPGVIFQKGHFLFADEQTLVVSKYNNTPDGVSVGYTIKEKTVNALEDASLFDNANGSSNENAPGADRLRLEPELTVINTEQGNNDLDFFALVRYQLGNAITVRDVSQYNVLGEEMARRTYEESGNYVLENFDVLTDDLVPSGQAGPATEVHAILGTGVAYVKGYRVENSAERAFQLDQISTTVVAENQAVSTSYGYYVDVTQFNGHVDIDRTDVNLQNSSGTNIGIAQVVNLTPTKAFLTNITMSGDISDLAKLSDGNGEVLVGNKLKETGGRPLIFKTGMSSVFATSDTLIPVRAQVQATATNNVITITANPGEDFVCDNNDVLVVAQGGAYPTINSVVTAVNNSELVITLDASGGPWGTVYVYYNKRLIGSSGGIEPYGKIVKTPFIRVNYTSATTKYSLGFPDVYQIISIADLSGNDFTNSFRLNSNQKDSHYDISYIEYIQGRPQPANGQLIIQMKVFKVEASTGEYFFTISSYPNTIESYDIPAYTADSGSVYNLRESFDFRPVANKIAAADYEASVGATSPLITIPVGSSAPSFTDLGVPLIPSNNQAITTDIEYYLSRIDSVVVDSYGGINLVKGKEQEMPSPPSVTREQLAIANIFIPGYPALSARQANAQNKRAYAITAKSTGVKNFTMKDMHSLEKKIDNLSYYVSLNQLESDTANLTILDENGLNRFKNGFIVDSFNDMALSNIKDPLFDAAIPFSRKILTPSVKQFPIDLKYKSSANASLFPSATNAKVGTLSRDSNVAIIEQPAATGFRTCAANFYQYKGNGVISPPYDVAYDVTSNPVTIDVDMSSAFDDLIDNVQERLPLTDVRYEFIDYDVWPYRNWWWNNRWGQYDYHLGYRGWGYWPGTWRQVTTQRNIDIKPPENTSVSVPVGDFVSNFQFKPFIASRDIKVYMSGLRPDTRHYFFFDKQDVNTHVYPGTLVDDVDGVQRNGQAAEAITTDSNGVLRAVFNIPAETFFVGDRVLDIVDVDSYANIESASTSTGFVTYRAYNFSVERSGTSTATRTPDIDVNTTTTLRNVVRRPQGRDPLAQTFFVKKGMGAGSNTIFVSQVDVYFKRVSGENGITLQLREVLNGFPTNKVIPFSKVHKTPTQMAGQGSDDGTTATTFTFDAPVRLDVEKEYAIVLQADANDPNYLLFTSKVGESNLVPGETQGGSVSQDWGDGVLFSSTNNSAWKSYQDEDLKFKLYRHNFNQSSGSVTLTHADCEFFTISNVTGRFAQGETVYQEKALTAGSAPSNEAASVTINTAILTGQDLDQNYADGDFILITAAGATPRKDIFKVLSIDSSTQITLDKTCSFTVSGGTHKPVVIGTVAYYNPLRPFDINLEHSSARTGRLFVTGTNVIGFDSGVTANLSAVNDINLSYFQSMIAKTDDSVSTTNLAGTFVPTADPNATYQKGMKFNTNNHFSEKGVILYSKSNDPNMAKAFDITVELENQGNVTSTPFVDLEISKIFAYQYNITNTANTTSKFISNRVELSADLDAEDINVIVTGYRPKGSDIKVYIRPQNAYDGQSFNEIDWIELELFEGVNVFSSNINIGDYKEFKYRVASGNKDVDGVLTYTSSAGTFSGYRKFAIRIDMLAENIHSAPTLADYRAIALT